ncbi:MAG: 50S ribosomal protein L22 [bacterium]
MEARAVSRYIRISPRKTRQVADLVRGKSVEQALSILALTPKKASPILKKAILSAVANARFMNEGDVELDDGSLFIKEIKIDEGPTMKRIRPRAQGRAFRILKRMSHIQVTVSPDL